MNRLPSRSLTHSDVPMCGSHAIVIGGSVSGLLASRVLADAFTSVTVLEKDPVFDDDADRKSVPQRKHAHILLEAGRQVLTSFFPKYQNELMEGGGVEIDSGRDVNLYTYGDFVTPITGREPMWCATRSLFEQKIREEVTKINNITIKPGTTFTGYLTAGDENKITGVEYRDQNGEINTLAGELTIDATGRNSRTGKWLDRNGYTAPKTDRICVDLAYSTVMLERNNIENPSASLCLPNTPNTHGGTIVPIENGKWLVTVFGRHNNKPPTEKQDVISFAENLPLDAIPKLLRENKWVSESGEYHPFASNKWNHYERLDAFPDGLLVVGDAVRSINPIYGQGISLAALDAFKLHQCLRSGSHNLSDRFFDRITGHTEDAWEIAALFDFRFEETSGNKPLLTPLYNKYISLLMKKTHTDTCVAEAFGEVVHLEQDSSHLLKPDILKSVLLFPVWK